MNSGSESIEDMAAAIDGRNLVAHLRVTISRRQDEDADIVRYFEAVVGERPPGWLDQRWLYPEVEFTSGEVTGSALASWLTGDGYLPLAGTRAKRPDLQPSANWNERPSLYRRAAVRLPWPSREWSVHVAVNGGGVQERWQPDHMLVGRDAPTFALFQVAHRAFYTGDFSSLGANQIPSDFGRLWRVQSEAWLRRVRIGMSSVEADVRGSAVAGKRIEVVGSEGHVAKPVGTSGRVRLRLPKGVGTDAWLYLTDGERCFDYRVLGDSHLAQADLERQGVEFVVPDDPEARIGSMLGQVESPRLEYKREIPHTEQSVDRVMKTVAAFATGEGGAVVFGVEPDEITLTGLRLDNWQLERDRLYQLVRDRISPAPPVDIQIVDYDGRSFAILTVPSGPEPPYALTGDTPKYYIRRGTHTCPARPDELRHAILSRQPTSTSFATLSALSL